MRIAVIGGGTMGVGIAHRFAARGAVVSVVDVDLEINAKHDSTKTLYRLFQRTNVSLPRCISMPVQRLPQPLGRRRSLSLRVQLVT